MNEDINQNVDFKVNVADLKAMKEEMLGICNKLEESCKTCYKKIEDSKRVYNAPAGDYFREKSSQFVSKNQTYIVDVVIPYVNRLDEIINEYGQLYEDIKKDIEGNSGSQVE